MKHWAKPLAYAYALFGLAVGSNAQAAISIVDLDAGDGSIALTTEATVTDHDYFSGFLALMERQLHQIVPGVSGIAGDTFDGSTVDVGVTVTDPTTGILDIGFAVHSYTSVDIDGFLLELYDTTLTTALNPAAILGADDFAGDVTVQDNQIIFALDNALATGQRTYTRILLDAALLPSNFVLRQTALVGDVSALIRPPVVTVADNDLNQTTAIPLPSTLLLLIGGIAMARNRRPVRASGKR
ncbi:MAG: hypothetical protein KDH88_14550 [Chromatiales bacterium]|nr:hypothetical protein [Chromatiales bacterium]